MDNLEIDTAIAEFERLTLAVEWLREYNAQVIFYELDGKNKRVEIRYRNAAGMLVFTDAEDLISAIEKAIAQAAGKAARKSQLK